MLAVFSDVTGYVVQMLPMCVLSLLVFFLLRPCRIRRLEQAGLVSGPVREGLLCFFLLFCGGTAALTLFPADLWSDMISMDRMDFLHRYPSWEQTLARIEHLPAMLTPLREIRRILSHMSYWGLFMLVGNVALFVPVGAFTAMLWRGWTWWRMALLGLLVSGGIETVQFFIGRRTDIDDVILNTAGVLLGFWVFCVVRTLFPDITAKTWCRPKGGFI